ncbi:hypothetical protein SUGI_0859040 [Cryptomeria japonica]|uniref:LOB domain-containing protein 23-like n=1 Tax=Cryptomeria japonica TaxID=3369 RepID=UPI002414910B|nr:LOB domain-containing protein 23-like [Cryptomeria japonica]GLJ41497.1 hypothetical protein SUGI_0859040 [Cryptomeria japonica]
MAARGGGGPCGACKFLRRKCVEGCVFAPYFSTEEVGAAHFAAIHKIFGASNFSKLLHNIPSDQERFDAVVSISYEAQARLQDPVYGCVSHISALQQQVAHLQGELAFAYSKLASGSDRASLSPCHVSRKKAEIIMPVSFVNSPFLNYNSLNTPQSNHQRAYDNILFSPDVKGSSFPKYQNDHHYDPLVPAQQMNVPQDNRSVMEASLDEIGDLQALVSTLLRKNRS